MTQMRAKWGWDGGGVRVLTPAAEVGLLLREIETPPDNVLALQAWAAKLALFTAAGGDGDDFAMPEDLAEYWLYGEGALEIGWCTDGSFDRARRALRDKIPPEQLDGAVANLYRRACGKHPGPHND